MYYPHEAQYAKIRVANEDGSVSIIPANVYHNNKMKKESALRLASNAAYNKKHKGRK